ncbi:MAG: LysR family transcriptional regulator, partial [Halioglobus sp.]|nr:LysR family transcriptional regulator [Halioglobus sp.]
MRHLNYSHLHYFWTVANEGSIARASETLHITPQTISGQLKLLDEAVGEPLFQRAGRGLVLSDTGRVVKQYADEIFALGAELSRVVRGGHAQSRILHVGLVDSIPKLIAYRVLQPLLSSTEPVQLVCTEG